MKKNKSFIFYESYYDKVKALSNCNPELAQELLFAIIEFGLFGYYDVDPDNESLMDALMSEARIQISNSAEKYQRKLDITRQEKIDKEDLLVIAKYVADGKTQTQIAKELHVDQSTISRRLSLIKTDYPELLSAASMDLAQELKTFADEIKKGKYA